MTPRDPEWDEDDFEDDDGEGSYEDEFDEEREEIVLEVVRYFSAALAQKGWSASKILKLIDDTELDYELAAVVNPNIEDMEGRSFEFGEMLGEFNKRLAEEVKDGVKRAKG